MSADQRQLRAKVCWSGWKVGSRLAHSPHSSNQLSELLQRLCYSNDNTTVNIDSNISIIIFWPWYFIPKV